MRISENRVDSLGRTISEIDQDWNVKAYYFGVARSGMFQSCIWMSRSCFWMSFGISSRKAKVFHREHWSNLGQEVQNTRENRDASATFSASHGLRRQVCLSRAMFPKERFSLAFYRRNRLFPLKSSLFYTVKNPNLLVCRLNSPPMDQNFSSVLRPEV